MAVHIHKNTQKSKEMREENPCGFNFTDEEMETYIHHYCPLAQLVAPEKKKKSSKKPVWRPGK